MKKYLLEEFEKELSQINEYIKHIQQINDLAGIEVPNDPVFQEFKTHFLSFRNDKKLFEYKAVIISLYGLLEKYIEQWVQAYLTRLSSFVAYDKLSESLKNKHFELSIKLIGIVSEGRREKYNHLKKEDILKKLNTCIENQQFYNFNAEAFTIQSGNLTHNRVEEIFKTVDISISKELVKNLELISLIGISSSQIPNTESNVLFSKINELVERRNTIAHGANIDDLLELSALAPYIEFFEKYCIAIFKVLEEEDIKNQTIEKFQEFSCQGVFTNKTVIGLAIKNKTIKIGESVIIKTPEKGNEHFYKKEIKSIGKNNNNDYSELVIEEKTNVSVGIDNHESLPITQQCTFYLEK
jgi:hypothetical protein